VERRSDAVQVILTKQKILFVQLAVLQNSIIHSKRKGLEHAQVVEINLQIIEFIVLLSVFPSVSQNIQKKLSLK